MKYRFQGTIKAITFKDARVSVLLENTTFMSNEGDWKQWVDWKLIEGGKYKKGDVWVSAFEQSAPQVFQACKMIEKGSEVEVEIFKTEKGFLNINSMQLKVPEKDINEDLEPPSEEDEKRMADEPSSDQRPEDSPEAQAEKMLEEEAKEEKASSELDKQMKIRATEKDVLIVRQTCIKAVGAIFKISQDKWARDVDIAVTLAMRLEKFVLEGK